MGIVGQACLIIALGLCAYGAGASVVRRAHAAGCLVLSGRRALLALAAVVTLAFVMLEYVFLTRTSTSPSSRRTRRRRRRGTTGSPPPGPRRRARSCCGCGSCRCGRRLAITLLRGRLRDVAPYATAVLLGFGAFFAALLIFTASPFEGRLATGPAEGLGLNPLLRHPSMMIHPVMLYSGYTLFAIPFAFAIGALIVRRVDAEWIRATRVFSLRRGSRSASGSSSARAGRTPSSAGAATGPGTRSRTPRCCRGSPARRSCTR